MFFFYLIFILLCIFVIFIVSTSIQIHIENIRFSTEKREERYLNKNYRIIVKLYFCEKIKFFQFDIMKKQIEKSTIQKMIQKIEQKMIEDRKNWDIKILKQLKILKDLKIKVKKFHLKIDIGLEDAAAGAISVGIVSSFIANFFRKLIHQNSEIFWKVRPVYQNRNLVNINLDCIFRMKMIHIIYTIYILKKKGEKENGTSNRRTYAYSHE